MLTASWRVMFPVSMRSVSQVWKPACSANSGSAKSSVGAGALAADANMFHPVSQLCR